MRDFEKEEKIEKNFQKLLKDRFPIFYNGLGIHWRDGGIDGLGFVGIGWFGILYELGEKVEPELEKMPEDERCRIVQIKEKFASLTIYVRGVRTEKINNAISEAVKKSLKTCEWCGKKGSLSNLGWMKILCDECHNQRLKERGGPWIIN